MNTHVRRSEQIQIDGQITGIMKMNGDVGKYLIYFIYLWILFCIYIYPCYV